MCHTKNILLLKVYKNKSWISLVFISEAGAAPSVPTTPSPNKENFKICQPDIVFTSFGMQWRLKQEL